MVFVISLGPHWPILEKRGGQEGGDLPVRHPPPLHCPCITPARPFTSFLRCASSWNLSADTAGGGSGVVAIPHAILSRSCPLLQTVLLPYVSLLVERETRRELTFNRS